MKTQIEYDPECRWSKFDALRDLLKVFSYEVKQGKNTFLHFEKMIQTGDCPLGSYGAGFLNVEIWTTSDPYLRDQTEDCYNVRIRYANTDDGDYGGWSKPMGLEKANGLAERVMMEVYSDMVSLSSTDEINKTLRPYGLRVDFE